MNRYQLQLVILMMIKKMTKREQFLIEQIEEMGNILQTLLNNIVEEL
jgi:hypothetical protein